MPGDDSNRHTAGDNWQPMKPGLEDLGNGDLAAAYIFSTPCLGNRSPKTWGKRAGVLDSAILAG